MPADLLPEQAASDGAVAARERAAALAAAHPIDPPPLRAMAAELGIVEVDLRDDLPAAGLLIARPDGGYVAVVRSNDPPSRQRFSLAHEMAHLILKDEGLTSSVGHQDAEIERLCDAVAAELLLPRRHFAFDDGRPHLEKAIEAASRCWASPTAAALRLCEVLPDAAIMAWGTVSRPGSGPKLRLLWGRSRPGTFLPVNATPPEALGLATLAPRELSVISATVDLGSLRGTYEFQSVRMSRRGIRAPEVLSVVPTTSGGGRDG